MPADVVATATNKNNAVACSVTRNGVIANETNGFGVWFGLCR